MTLPTTAEPHDGLCGAATRAGSTCTQRAGWGTDHVGAGRCKLHGGSSLVRHGRYSTIKREELRDLIEQHEADPDPLNLLSELAAARALFQDFIERYDEWREAILAWHATYSPAMRPIHPTMVQALEDVVDELESHIEPVPEKAPARLEPEGQPHGGWLERHRADTEESRINASVRTVRLLIESLQVAPDLKPREVLDLSDAIRHLDVISKIVERIEKIGAANAISRPNLMRIMAEMGNVVRLANHEADPAKRLDSIHTGWRGIRLA